MCSTDDLIDKLSDAERRSMALTLADGLGIKDLKVRAQIEIAVKRGTIGVGGLHVDDGPVLQSSVVSSPRHASLTPGRHNVSHSPRAGATSPRGQATSPRGQATSPRSPAASPQGGATSPKRSPHEQSLSSPAAKSAIRSRPGSALDENTRNAIGQVCPSLAPLSCCIPQS